MPQKTVTIELTHWELLALEEALQKLLNNDPDSIHAEHGKLLLSKLNRALAE